MASQGPLSVGTAADDSAVGSITWSNTGNITASDNSRASAANGGAPTQAHYLKATNFGFSIPSGATIDGILVEVERKKQNSIGSVSDTAVKIVKGGTVGSTNKAIGGYWSTTDTYISYGGSSDLWGETWSDSDINATDFGVVFSPTVTGGKGAGVANVDHIRVTVYYTETGSASLSPSISPSLSPSQSPSASISPSSSPSVSPSLSPSVSPSVSESPSVSPSPSFAPITSIRPRLMNTRPKLPRANTRTGKPVIKLIDY